MLRSRSGSSSTIRILIRAGGVLSGKNFLRQFAEMVAQATLSGDEEKADVINSQSLINTLTA